MCRTLQRFHVDSHDEIVHLALVQTFEFTFELAWNTMKDYLEFEGFNQIRSSKQAIRTAFQIELIDDAEKWMSVVEKCIEITPSYIVRSDKNSLCTYV